MKARDILFLFIALGLLASCNKKNNEPKQFENANTINVLDTTIEVSSLLQSFESVSFQLDIDLDKVADLSFTVSIDPDYNDHIKSLTINTFNNFEFAVQNSYEIREGNFNENSEWIVDSVLVEIPMIFGNQSTVSNSLSFGTDNQKLAFYHSWKHNSYYGNNRISGFSNMGIKYIGIRNQTNDILGWIKIEVIDFNKIIIKSFYYSIGQNSLIINE